MKKRGIFPVFTLIFLLILIPNALSIYEELIYSETVEDGDIVNISNSLFEFKIDSASNKVYIEIDVSGIIIKNGECKIKDKLDICVSNINFSYRNLTSYYDVYKALIKVYQIKAKLDTTNTIEKNNILIDEETTATLSFENIADIVAGDVTATIKIHPSLLVTEVEGCKKTADKIMFKGNVHPRQIQKCNYKVKGLNASDFELKANITYFDGIENVSATSSTISGKVYNYSLRITSLLNKTKFNIGEKLNLTMNIENINDQYSLTVTTLGIKLPQDLLLIKKQKGTTYNNKVIGWSGTLAPKENKEIKLELKGLRTGNHSISVESSYKISKFLRAAKEISNLEVYCDCPYVAHEFSQGIVVPDQRIGLKAFVINPSLTDTFKNVKVGYLASIPNIQDFSTAYSEISPLGSIKIFDSSFITPPLNETYRFDITVAYESIYNQIFVVRDNIIIEIPKEVEEETKVQEEEIEEEPIINETGEEIQEEVEETVEAEKTEEIINETEKQETSRATPVTTIKDEKSRPFSAYVIIGLITGSLFLLFLLIGFRRGMSEGKEKAEDERTKQFLSNILKKKETKEKETEYRRREAEDYKFLERQIRKLGDSFESGREKPGFFGRFFKRK